MEKKKVLFTATVVKTHIMQFHIPYLKMFQEMGWETAVAARNDYENHEDCTIPHCDRYFDVPFERMPWKLGNGKAYKMLKKIIREGDYDIIHCHTPVGAMLTRLAAIGARKRGTKVVYTAHGFHFFQGAPMLNWLLYYPVEWVLAHVTDILVTINKEDFALAQKRMRAKKVVYIPGVGVDTEKFQRVSVNSAQKRRELGCGETDFLLLTVAEMTKNKNHSTVLKALARLKDRPEFARMKYLICGRGEQKEALEAEAKALGISDHVLFLGYRNDVSELYHCADLFVFMPFREGLPVSLMEAMCCGMPTVCSRIRGNTDLIRDGLEGLFAENTPQGVANAILALYRDKSLRGRLGTRAMERSTLFDAKNIHRQMKELYMGLSEEGKA